MKRTRVLYLEVADKIKADIFSGKYPVGSMLPTENELEEMFQVSKITVRKAIELLASDEYVEKKSGRGTTVLSNRPYNRLSKAASFTQILENSQHEVRKETLELTPIDLAEEDPLFSSFGNQAVRFKRLYYLNEKPYIYFVHYLPKAVTELEEKMFYQESLYRLLTQKGYAIDQFSDDFSAVFLSKEEQAILKTTEPLGMKRIRRSLTEDGQLVEYSEAIYHTALHPYHIDYET
ncbi:GntR family transcriptional regulator [Enterococcus thailandicus]|uniref:GntR family transcriptional regulator n=1 Tax=Enterococcus TaxID=1350 RepID=UPI0022EBDE40|nr:GntR family transcriptional regulator [Enterococcus thailandicus]MDA3965798.1 GntR family transcriptional regulator [Enterococcus thailandicus]MDK4353103.1 GntR family transcriptional regulator [Enterococcus thailandicus]MDT2735243.1 GntR family transcriptional regulator [Enterococcus thailandicus]